MVTAHIIFYMQNVDVYDIYGDVSFSLTVFREEGRKKVQHNDL